MKKTYLILMFAMLLASPVFSATYEENKKILKDAIVGAITGAVSTEATKEDSVAGVAASEADVHKHEKKKNKNFSHKDKKEKRRPHGWDMGKKTGWGNKDVPPGLAKKGDD